MRKINLIIVLSCLLYLISCCDCDKKDKKDIIPLTGKMTWQEWKSAAEWEDYSAKNYKPDEKKVDELKRIIEGNDSLNYILFTANWCDDSEKEVPKIYKLFENLGQDLNNIALYGVNRNKTEPTGTAVKYKIDKVPTMIILKGDIEIGRIVEAPILNWEDDLFTILEE